MTKLINPFLKSDFEIVEINDRIHSRIKIQPMYFELGFSPYSTIYSRRAVVDRLLKALEYLPLNYGFLVWDVYRPRFVQEKLFHWMREEVRKQYPHLTEQENYHETCKYASPPSKIGDEYCPPHLSGGAIDLTLFDMTAGCALEMGTAFDDCTERAHSRYFASRSLLSLKEQIIQERRNILLSSMEKTGFVSYQYEWWHFDIGNIFWSKITGNPAVFGPLFGDQEWPRF